MKTAVIVLLVSLASSQEIQPQTLGAAVRLAGPGFFRPGSSFSSSTISDNDNRFQTTAFQTSNNFQNQQSSVFRSGSAGSSNTGSNKFQNRQFQQNQESIIADTFQQSRDNPFQTAGNLQRNINQQNNNIQFRAVSLQQNERDQFQLNNNQQNADNRFQLNNNQQRVVDNRDSNILRNLGSSQFNQQRNDNQIQISSLQQNEGSRFQTGASQGNLGNLLQPVSPQENLGNRFQIISSQQNVNNNFRSNVNQQDLRNSFQANNQNSRFSQESRSQSDTFQESGSSSDTFSAAVDSVYEPLNLPSGASRLLGQISTSFSCVDRPYGYYADQDNDCRVFHICNPYLFSDGSIQTYQYSFMCGEETEFDQNEMTCVERSSATPCQEASNFYFRNEQFGRREDKAL